MSSTDTRQTVLDEVEKEIYRIGDVRPHVATAEMSISLLPSQVASMILEYGEAITSEEFLSCWASSSRENPATDSAEFVQGLLDCARVDTVAYLSEHTEFEVEELMTKDISEAVAVQMAAYMISEMVLHETFSARERPSPNSTGPVPTHTTHATEQ